jgi:hypothetical protein
MHRTKKIAGFAALSCAAFAASGSPAQAAELFHGVTSDNRLVQFTSDAPQDVSGGVPIGGLQQGENVVGLDVRPASDALYALTSAGRIYQVNPLTGATRIFSTTPALNGASFGVDVNPVPDALRITSDTEQNLRVRFDNGNGTMDTNLQYAEGDPGAGSNPAVTAVGYTNSVPNATETQLFGIDAARDALVRIDPPNAGTLRTVGALGTDIGEAIGFDISATGNNAYALVLPQGAEHPQLVRVDLSNGRAAPAATEPTIALPEGRLRGLAAAGPVPDDNAAPEASVAFSSTILEQNTSTLRPSVSCDETCAITVAASVDGRAAGTARGAILGAGRDTVEIPLNASARRRIARAGTELITLRITVVDAAGNDRTQTRRSRTQTLAARRSG